MRHVCGLTGVSRCFDDVMIEELTHLHDEQSEVVTVAFILLLIIDPRPFLHLQTDVTRARKTETIDAAVARTVPGAFSVRYRQNVSERFICGSIIGLAFLQVIARTIKSTIIKYRNVCGQL